MNNKPNINIDMRLEEYASFTSQAVFSLLVELDIHGVIAEKASRTDGATLPRWIVFAALLLVGTTAHPTGIFQNILFWLGYVAITFSYLFPAFGRYTLAAIAHDVLLEKFDRKTADRKMKEILELMEINTFWAVSMYRLVRINSYFKNLVIG